MAENSNSRSFCVQMRKATRGIHKISDSLVNAKLAFALSDDNVWADGVLVFYEIFKFLEDNVPADILPVEFHRREAFEEDLLYYLGNNWKDNYEIRLEVLQYLQHLETIKNTNSTMLIAYVYHLYMGLLSGGQILQKKRSIARRIYPLSNNHIICPGEKLTYFDGFTIMELKTLMRSNIDRIANDLDDKTKEDLLNESKKVFELNNQIIKTVKDVNKAGFKKILILSIIILLVALLLKYILF